MGETETTDTRPDARTAEVLRALQRAKGTVANTPLSSAPLEDRLPKAAAVECVPSRLNGGRPAQDPMESVAASLRALEHALVTATAKLADVQRAQDGAVREIRGSVQGLKRHADVVASWSACSTRWVIAWGVILALLIVAVATLSWRTHEVVLNTDAVLEQILENQARGQASKSGKRR